MVSLGILFSYYKESDTDYQIAIDQSETHKILVCLSESSCFHRVPFEFISNSVIKIDQPTFQNIINPRSSFHNTLGFGLFPNTKLKILDD